MRAWDTFYPRVLPDVIGCPEPTVDLALLDTARDFFQFTKAWREDLEATVLAATVSDYEFEVPTGAELVQAEDATLAGRCIRILLATTLQDRVSNNGQRGIQVIDTTQFRVLPTPAESGAELVIAAVLMPSETATGLPEEMADAYRLEIANGALARLLTMNKAAWANPTLAAIKETAYLAGRGRVQTRVWRARSASTPRSRGQYF